jgi:tagatose-6-phosphate ketose/aldose isomerase
MERLVAEDDAARRLKGTLHTPGEILQQPWLWRETAERVTALAPEARTLLKDRDFLVISGAGSSLHAGRLIEDAAKGRFGSSAQAVSCTDLLLATERYIPQGRRGVLLSLSRSGESPETVEAARRIGQDFPEVAQMAITCNGQSTLARLLSSRSDDLCVALHEKSYDRGLATTSSVTSTALAGRFLVDPVDPTEFNDRVRRLADSVQGDLAGRLEQSLAALDAERVIFLGTGALEAAAQESAHKILELTDGQVPVMARSPLEFRHGPIAFVTPRTLVAFLIHPDRRIQVYERDLLRQLVSSKTALRVIALGSGNPEVLGTEADQVVPWMMPGERQAGEQGIWSIVFAQLLALFMSLRRGFIPDRPHTRGLVNPVVQGVTIHERKGGA